MFAAILVCMNFKLTYLYTAHVIFKNVYNVTVITILLKLLEFLRLTVNPFSFSPVAGTYDQSTTLSPTQTDVPDESPEIEGMNFYA